MWKVAPPFFFRKLFVHLPELFLTLGVGVQQETGFVRWVSGWFGLPGVRSGQTEPRSRHDGAESFSLGSKVETETWEKVQLVPTDS